MYNRGFNILVFMNPNKSGGFYNGFYFNNEPVFIMINNDNNSDSSLIFQKLYKHLNITTITETYFEELSKEQSVEAFQRMKKGIGTIDSSTGPLYNRSINPVIFKNDNLPEFVDDLCFYRIRKGWPKGKTQTSEHKRKRSEALKGYKFSKDRNNKIRDFMLNRPTPSYLYGNEHRSLSWIVISPEGIYKLISNLSKFCRENNLSQPVMCKIASGKRNSYKGWKCKKANVIV